MILVIKEMRQICWLQTATLSVSNYRSFDFIYIKFDRSSYLKICAKYHFFLLWIALSIQILKE